MPDSDIKFRVSQEGAEKVSQDFKKVDDSIDDMQDSGRRTSPTIRELGKNLNTSGLEAKQYAGRMGEAAITTGTMAGILGAGLIVGLAIATTALYDIAKPIYEARMETKKFTEAIDGAIQKLIQFEDPLKGITFGFKTEAIDPIIAILDRKIAITEARIKDIIGDDIFGVAEYALNELGILDELSPMERKRFELNKGMLEVFEKQKYSLEAQKMLAEEMEKLGGKKIVKEEKSKNTTKKTSEYAKALNEAYKELIKTLSALPPPRGDIRFRGLVTGVPVPEKPKITFSKEEEEYFSRINDLTIISAGVLRDEFTKAWEDVFGEANSLFEKLAMRISEYFADIALRYAALNLFSAITGVPVNVIAGGGAAGASPASAATLDKSINIILDGEVVGTFIDNRVPYSVSKAVRLDII